MNVTGRPKSVLSGISVLSLVVGIAVLIGCSSRMQDSTTGTDFAEGLEANEINSSDIISDTVESGTLMAGDVIDTTQTDLGWDSATETNLAELETAEIEIGDDTVVESTSFDDTIIDQPMAAPPTEAQIDTMTAGTITADTTTSFDTNSTTVEQTMVESVAIENEGPGGNQIVAALSGPAMYSVQRSAQTEYVVTIEDAMISTGVAKAILATPQSGLLRSVRAVQDGSDVLLRVFTSGNVDVSGRNENGKIIIEASAGSTTNQMLGANETFGALPEGEPMAQVGEAIGATSGAASLAEPDRKYTGRLISLDLQDTDIDNALRIIAEVSNLNIISSDDVTGKVTLRLIDVPWDQALDVILKTNGLDKVQENNVIRIAPVEKLRAEREALKEAQRAAEELAPLMVRYIRISYAKASDVQGLVEAVLTERGSVAVDERSNQIIVKDIQQGISNVAELISKLDLRTPQVLLETQIVEAQRNFLRDLGTEVGFSYIHSPQTGNALDYNFPNSVAIGGGVTPEGVASSFPAAVSDSAGSAITALFGSADGTRSLDLRVSALEQEGRVRIVSRPSVATVNNKPAVIKSVEKIRVKSPASGVSVTSEGGSSTTGSAFETFEIGIELEVTPQASPDYFVLMDINAKSSTLGSQVVDGIPSEVERSATSTVLVSSGQTFALGGIYKITDQDSLDGVPFFKDIPVLGQMFRRQIVDNSDEELIFFITPRIVEGSFDDAAMRATVG